MIGAAYLQTIQDLLLQICATGHCTNIIEVKTIVP